MASLTNNQTLTPLQRVYKLLRQYRIEIRYVWLYAIVAGLINLSLPLGIQAIIGLLAGGSISASWGVLVFFVVLGALFTGLLRLMQLSIMEHFQRRIFTEVAMDFSLRIPRLNLEHLQHEHLPEVINRFFETTTLQKGLPKMLIEGLTASITIIFSLTLLSFYHASFVVFSVGLLLALLIIFYILGPRGLQTSLVESKYKYKLVYWLEEVGRVVTTFKLAGANRFPEQRADVLTSAYLDARARHWRILAAQFVGGIIFRVMVVGIFLIMGSVLVMQNELNLGQFVASEILVLFVVEAVDKLIQLLETGYDVLTATEKLGQISDLPLEPEDGLVVEDFSNPTAPFSVEVRDLNYRFSDGAEYVLKNINLKIKPGERVAITGYPSSGKSVLVRLFSGLLRDYEGVLLFNNLPMQNLNLRSLRCHIGDLSSQEDIFKGTLMENITLGNTQIPLSRVLHLIEQTGLSSFVEKMPEGIHSELLPGGKGLPASIVTRILIARSIASKPNMLALEKPLRNLNLRDRVQIASLLTTTESPWTMVCATEDPLMASVCDRVLVLRQGEVVFDGDFPTLMKTEHSDQIFRYSLNAKS